MALCAAGSSAIAATGAEPVTREEIVSILREIGPQIEVARTGAVYAPLVPAEPYGGVTVIRDVAYGPHERHVFDVFTGVAAHPPLPVVVFVHGGGFKFGAKRMPGVPFYDNIGVWAARNGFAGITINYRLAPEFQYPAGAEDLSRLVDWLQANAGKYGFDPRRIYLWGHSAGAAHVADYIARTPRTKIAGAVLTSGIYHLENGGRVSPWKDYYGEDVSKYRDRSSVPGLVRSRVPLLIVYAELDPPEFIADTQRLIEACQKAGKRVQTVRLTGHSHVSETYAVGTDDDSLSAPVRAFVTATAR